MKLSELILKRRLTRFSSVIPLLLPLYMDVHVWNDDDYVADVYERKRTYIIDKILLLYTKNNNIDCTPRYKWALDGKGDPRINGETGDPIQELDVDNSDVNLVELIRFMVNDQKDRLAFPSELLIAAGIPLPSTIGVQKGIGEDSDVGTAEDTNYQISGGIAPPEAASLTTKRIIEAIYQAVLFCFRQDQGDPVTNEDIAASLARKGFTDVQDETLEFICDQMPMEIRTVAVPLNTKERRAYGSLKLQIDNVNKAIEASVEAALYMEALPEGVKISDDDLHDWLHKKGYGDLTTRMVQKLWQVLPSKHKKSAGAKKIVVKTTR